MDCVFKQRLFDNVKKHSTFQVQNGSGFYLAIDTRGNMINGKRQRRKLEMWKGIWKILNAFKIMIVDKSGGE